MNALQVTGDADSLHDSAHQLASIGGGGLFSAVSVAVEVTACSPFRLVFSLLNVLDLNITLRESRAGLQLLDNFLTDGLNLILKLFETFFILLEHTGAGSQLNFLSVDFLGRVDVAFGFIAQNCFTLV